MPKPKINPDVRVLAKLLAKLDGEASGTAWWEWYLKDAAYLRRCGVRKLTRAELKHLAWWRDGVWPWPK